ncbi:MAG: acyl-CoA desaturase [Elusimicrobia bacterium]|nr:acyl-CoA desaturase [Elusimicrobiota bacterium]
MRLGAVNNAAFAGVHLACLGAFWTGVDAAAAGVCAALYLVRMFAITAGYHRYFSHRAFKTGRAFQFLLGLLGATSGQKGPLWWAAHHRNHHRYSDTKDDVHSPRHGGFWWSHAGWILSPHFAKTRLEAVPDLARFPELVWLDRWHFLAPVTLGLACAAHSPRMLVWGFFVSTTLLYHGTFTVNSLAHLFGSRRFATPDDSRNNPLVAALTLGEGWHNNHHQFPSVARQGLTAWELDPSHGVLKLLAAAGLVGELRAHPPLEEIHETQTADLRPRRFGRMLERRAPGGADAELA